MRVVRFSQSRAVRGAHDSDGWANDAPATAAAHARGAAAAARPLSRFTDLAGFAAAATGGLLCGHAVVVPAARGRTQGESKTADAKAKSAFGHPRGGDMHSKPILG